eukprot:scaffold20364_cov112-Isochrysis_galbana.AAC.8
MHRSAHTKNSPPLRLPSSSNSGGAADRSSSWSDERRLQQSIQPVDQPLVHGLLVRHIGNLARPVKELQRDSCSAPVRLPDIELVTHQPYERGRFTTRLVGRRRYQKRRSPRASAVEEQRAHQPGAGVDVWGHEQLGYHVDVCGARLPQTGLAGEKRTPLVEVEDLVAQASQECHDVGIRRIGKTERIGPGRLRLVATEAHPDEHASQLERPERGVDLIGLVPGELPERVTHELPNPLYQVLVQALGHKRHGQSINQFAEGPALLFLLEGVAARAQPGFETIQL